MSAFREIPLILPDDPAKLNKVLERFEALCRNNDVNEQWKITKLFGALQRSVHFERCDELIGTDEMFSYEKLKDVILREVKPVEVDEWKALLSPTKIDPLGTYNRIRSLKPAFTDQEILPFLQPHLHWMAYANYKNTDWSLPGNDLKAALVQYVASTKGANMGSPANASVGGSNVDVMTMIAKQSQDIANLTNLVKSSKVPATLSNIELQAAPEAVSSATPANETQQILQGLQTMQAQINAIATNRSSQQPNANQSGAVCTYHAQHKGGAYMCQLPCDWFCADVYTNHLGNGKYARPRNSPYNGRNHNNYNGRSSRFNAWDNNRGNNYQAPANYPAPPQHPAANQGNEQGLANQSNGQPPNGSMSLLARLGTELVNLTGSGQTSNF